MIKENSVLFLGLSNSPIVSYKILKIMTKKLKNIFIIVDKKTKNNLQSFSMFLNNNKNNFKIVEIKENSQYLEDFNNINIKFKKFIEKYDINTIYFDVNIGFGFYRFIYYKIAFLNTNNIDSYLINLKEDGVLNISDTEFKSIQKLPINIISDSKNELENILKLYKVDSVKYKLLYRNGKQKISEYKNYDKLLKNFINNKEFRYKFTNYWDYYKQELEKLKDSYEKSSKYLINKLSFIPEFTQMEINNKNQLIDELYNKIDLNNIEIYPSHIVKKYFNTSTKKEQKKLEKIIKTIYVISPIKEFNIPVDELFENLTEYYLIKLIDNNKILKENILAIYSNVLPNNGKNIQIDILILLKNGKLINIELKTYHKTAKKKDLTARISNFKRIVGDKNNFFLVFPFLKEDIATIDVNEWKNTFKHVRELKNIDLVSFDEIEEKLLQIIKR